MVSKSIRLKVTGRQDPGSVGAALRTISLRLRGTSTKELEEAGEDTTGVVESKSKLRTKIQGYTGVDILTDTGAYKSTYEILLEISKVWDDLTDTDQAGLLELIAGKTRSNTAAAILSNGKDLEEALVAAQEAEGSALRENEKYLDSIQGKLDQFNNAVQTMWSNTLNDEWVKRIVEFGTKLIELVDDIGLIKIALMGVGMYLTRGIDFTTGFKPAVDSLEQMRKTLGQLKTEMEAAEKADLKHRTEKSAKKKDDATKRYVDYEAKVKEAEAAEASNKLAKERIELQNKLNAATEKYEKGLEILGGQEQDGTMAIEAWDEMAELEEQIKKNGMSLDDAKAKMKELGDVSEDTGKRGAGGLKKIGKGAKSVLKSLGGVLAQMAAMYAITTLLELGGKLIAHISEKIKENSDSYENAKDKFEELDSELSNLESELRSLESELENNIDRIDELLSQDTLSLVEQEELSKLQTTNKELERQIQLKETLAKQQQQSVNVASFDAMSKYSANTSFYSEQSKTERQEEAEEVGTTIGNVAGTLIGIAGAALVGYLSGGTMTATGYMVGAGIGSAIGGFLGGSFASSSEGSAYDSELTVGEAIDDMTLIRASLQADIDRAEQAILNTNGNATKEQKQALQDAEAALADFDSNMATSMNQLQQYLNAIDYSTLTDPKEQQKYRDALDDFLKYNIEMGVQGATGTAIKSIFSEELITEDAQAFMDAIQSAIADAEISGDAIDFSQFEGEEFEGIRARLAALGITTTQVVAHFEALKEAEDASLLYEPEDMVKSISKLSSSISDLKAAFDEFNESGVVTAETLMKLSETFGQLDGWKGFVDLASSGVASVQEMEDSINLLVESLFDQVVENPFQMGYDDPATEINEAAEAHKAYWTTIAQLQQLGVTNAKELVDAMQQKAVVSMIAAELKQGKKTKEQLIEEYTARYGLNALSAENLALLDEQIDKQAQLTNVTEQAQKFTKYQNDYFVNGGADSLTHLADFEASIEKTKGLNNKYSELVSERNNINAQLQGLHDKGYYDDDYGRLPLITSTNNTWESFGSEMLEFITLGLADTSFDEIDRLQAEYDAKTSEMNSYSALLQEQKDKRQQLFDELIAVATEAKETDGTDILEGIDVNNFDASDTSDTSVFNQVYSAVEKYVGDKKVEFEKLEKEIKAQLNTSFDSVGLEVILELQDKDKLVDDIQSIYDELTNAQKEYAENGYISVDTMQSLLKLEPKYLDMLVDEKGKLNLDKQALQEVARARIIDLGIKQQTAVYDEALALASEGSRDALLEEISAMETATETAEDWNAQQEEMIIKKLNQRVLDGDMEPSEANAFIEGIRNQIKAIQAVTNSALNNLNNSLSSSGNTATQEANNAFQDAMDYWENRIGAAESRFEQVQHEIDMLEATGKKAGAGYFQEQLNLLAGDGGKLSLLNQQLGEAKLALTQVPEGSEEWWEIANTINSIEGEIDDTILSIQDLKDAMADTHWYMFDEAHDRVSTLASDLENIRNILSNEKFFDDEGNFTEAGLGTLATYVQDLGAFEGALANAKAELDLFRNADGELEYDPNKTYVDAFGNDLSIDSEQDFYDAVEKAESKVDDWNGKIIDTKYNIKGMYEDQIDAIEEYTQTLVENYNEYIDAVKEALDSERDLYEFKKSTEKKSKDMAALERRIASLSGSTNAADVAERRKLQAELTDAKSDMDDHYYSHAKEQQSQALDNEMAAYETAMERYIEGLRTKLEESTAQLYLSYEEMGANTKSFIDGVTQSVVLNADNVKKTYLSTGETIDQALVTPWTNAAAAIGTFASSEGALGLMNSWTEAKAGKPFYDFQTKVSSYLSTPWSQIIGANGPVQNFKTSVTGVVSQIVNDVKTNVDGLIGTEGVLTKLQTEIDKIKDTTIRITTVYETQGNGGGYDSSGGRWYSYQDAKDAGFSNILGASQGEQRRATQNYGSYQNYLDAMYYKYMGKAPTFAKGTTGTTRDEWAIDSEPLFGDELVLVPTKSGNLSYMRKGTGVVPADLTANLMEWGQFTPDALNLGGGVNVNMINNAVNKPEFNFAFDALVKAENITEETLPAVKKLVTQELNRFTKELNYALKGKGAR